MVKRLFLLLAWILFPLQLYAVTLSTDGSDDKQQIDNPNIGSTAYTVCFWFFDDSCAGDGSIVSYATGGAQGWALHEDDDSCTLKFRAFAPGTEFASLAVAENAWNHICLAKSSGSGFKWYINATDATADQSDAFDPHTPISTDDFIVGGPPPSDPAGTGFGSFRIAHLAYWNTELSGAQIATLADKSTCPTAVSAANLKLFLKETDSPRVDSSSSAFTVVESGSPTTGADPGGLPCGGGGGGFSPKNPMGTMGMFGY